MRNLERGKRPCSTQGLPLLENEGFEVLPVVRVRYRSSQERETEHIANVYVFNVLTSWSALALTSRS